MEAESAKGGAEMISKKEGTIIQPREVFIGDLNAAVTLTEFADYESKAAVEVHAWVKDILHTYEGKLKFCFRHFPLRQRHQKAQKAAEAAVAAAQEGKFWEMHEMLLQNSRNLGTISLKSYAKAIGTINKRFLDELISGKYAWTVQDDLDEGIRLGIKEIPAFFLNSQKLEGIVTKEILYEKVEEAIRHSS
jgi:protein-disulfide isomerase